MKRILKHFFQTLILIALATGVAYLPKNAYYLNVLVWCLIGFVLLGTGIYLYRGHKKGLFCLLTLLGLLITIPTGAGAKTTVSCTNDPAVTSGTDTTCAGQEGEAYYKCLLETYDMDYCCGHGACLKLSDGTTCMGNSFASDGGASQCASQAIKKGVEPDPETTKKAIKFLDAWERAKIAGYVEESSSIVRSEFRLFVGELENHQICAQKFLDFVAEYKTKKAEMKTQTVYKLLQNDNKKCWPCGVAHTMLVAVEKISLSLEDILSQAAFELLGLMFLFWLLYRVLILIGQFGTGNNAEFFTDLLTRGIVAIIAASLLAAPMGFLYRHTFSPLLNITFGITDQFLTYGKATTGFGSTLAGSGSTYLGCDCCNSGSSSDCNDGKISECKIKYSSGTEEIGLFEKDTKRQLMCITCKAYKETAPMVAAGQVLVYNAWKNKTWLGSLISWVTSAVSIGMVSLVPSPFSRWVLGMALIVCFSWLAYSIAFRLIDIFLRIGFAVILTPFLITTFVFPISRQYTKRGWDFLVHALLSIMALSIGISFVMAVFMTSLPSSTRGELVSLMGKQNAGNDYAEKLQAAFGAGENGTLFTIFYLIMICFFGLNVLKASQVIIEGLSGITSGIPSICGTVVVAAIRAAMAPFRMVKNIVLDRLGVQLPGQGSGSGSDDKENDKPNSDADQPGVFRKIGKWTGDAAGRGAEAVQKGVGYLEEKGGGLLAKAGAKIAPMGYGLGSIVGVPLMVAGAGLKAKGAAMRKSAPMTRKAVRVAFRKGGKNVQRAWNKVKMKVKNRMKQVAAKIKKPWEGIKNLPRNIRNLPTAIKKRFQRRARRSQAADKYGRNRNRTDTNSSNNRRGGNEGTRRNNQSGDRNNSNNRPPETRGRRIARGIANIADTLESPVDNTINTVDQSFGDDPGNNNNG